MSYAWIGTARNGASRCFDIFRAPFPSPLESQLSRNYRFVHIVGWMTVSFFHFFESFFFGFDSVFFSAGAGLLGAEPALSVLEVDFDSLDFESESAFSAFL